MSKPSFQHLRVLAFESRRRVEIASLITTYGGIPISAPAMREVPLETNDEGAASVMAVVRGACDIFVALTGVGLRAAIDLAESRIGRAAFIEALGRVRVVARGPKPLAVLRELAIVPWVLAPSPNTWREVLAAIDAHGVDAVRGQRVIVQEYGTLPGPLLMGLEERGAHVARLPVYRYALPDDLQPLHAGLDALCAGEIDVVLFTTAAQIDHLLLVAERQGRTDAVRRALSQSVVASVGPTTSDELREQGIAVDLEASLPKMGVLVRDAATLGVNLRAAKS